MISPRQKNSLDRSNQSFCKTKRINRPASIESLEGRQLLSAITAAITTVSPSTGPVAGGTLVTVTGTGFTGATSVKFGTVSGTSLKVNSATSLTVTSPAESTGTVDIRVTTPDGTSPVVTADHFLFNTLVAPVVISPGTTAAAGSAITTLTPTFTWKAVTGVAFTGYQINLYDYTSGKFVSYFPVGTAVTSYTLPASGALTPGNLYVWNLRLLNGTQSGPPSAYLNFEYPAPILPAPVVISPGTTATSGSAITTLTPTFTWKAVTGVAFTGYQINLYDYTTGKSVSYFPVGTNVTSYTVPTSGALTPGNLYVWNLRLLNGTQSGPPSAYLYFEYPAATLPVPVAVSPGSTASPGPVLTTFSPTFTWHAVTGVTFTGYQLNVVNLTTGTTATYKVGTSVTSYTPTTQLAPGDKFVWNVRLLNGSLTGLPSDYLYFQSINLPAPVILGPGTSTSPGATLTTLTPTFTWKAVTGVTFDTYQINLYDITTGVFRSIQVSNTQTSYTLPAGTLTAGNSYVWNLRLKLGTTTGLESQPYLYFTAM